MVSLEPSAFEHQSPLSAQDRDRAQLFWAEVLSSLRHSFAKVLLALDLRLLLPSGQAPTLKAMECPYRAMATPEADSEMRFEDHPSPLAGPQVFVGVGRIRAWGWSAPSFGAWMPWRFLWPGLAAWDALLVKGSGTGADE